MCVFFFSSLSVQAFREAFDQALCFLQCTRRSSSASVHTATPNTNAVAAAHTLESYLDEILNCSGEDDDEEDELMSPQRRTAQAATGSKDTGSQRSAPGAVSVRLLQQKLRNVSRARIEADFPNKNGNGGDRRSRSNYVLLIASLVQGMCTRMCGRACAFLLFHAPYWMVVGGRLRLSSFSHRKCVRPLPFTC